MGEATDEKTDHELVITEAGDGYTIHCSASICVFLASIINFKCIKQTSEFLVSHRK